MGSAAASLAAAPVLLLSMLSSTTDRGGPVAAGLLPVLLWFCLSGNLAEEVLFRGFFQGRLEQLTSVARAMLVSAVIFAACHIFLASTVTDVASPYDTVMLS